MIVEKPWGTYEVLLEEPHYVVKRIVVKSGQRFSLQYHMNREEHWTVVGGTGFFEIGAMTSGANVGLTYFIPKGIQHRATAYDDDLVFIETQIGECDEEDIVRVSDDYGRS